MIRRKDILVSLRAFLMSGVIALLCLSAGSASAQLTVNVSYTGTASSSLAASYSSLAAAVTALNSATQSGAGSVVLTCSGTSETAPSGGYVITAQGTSTYEIIFEGSNKTLTASTQTSGQLYNAVIKIVGGDYITIQNFTLQENAANVATTPASNTMTEWGIALLYATTTNGAKNNTIKNNTISLNRTYQNSVGIYSSVAHTSTSVTAAMISAATGNHSNNKFYGNQISNVSVGIVLVGSSTTAAMDTGNDIGGTSATTGNTITNWGNASSPTAYTSVSNTIFGIYCNHQAGVNISYNSLTNASLSTVSAFRGIFVDYGTSPSSGTFTNNITNNTLTLTNTGTPSTYEVIRHNAMTTSLSGVTINITNNKILNCSAAGPFVGIVSSSIPGTLNINNNEIRGTTMSSTSGAFTGIQNNGACATAININNNEIGNSTGGALTYTSANSGTFTGITSSAAVSATTELSISNNNFQGITHNVASSGQRNFITLSGTGPKARRVNDNTFTNLSLNTTGSVSFISFGTVVLPANGIEEVNNNEIVTGFTKGGAGNTVTFFTAGGSTSATTSVITNSNNNFSNINVTGATTIAGWVSSNGSTSNTPNKTVSNNTFTNITGGSGAITLLTVGFGNPVNVSGNTLASVTGNGTTANTTALVLSGGTVVNAYKNKIYDIERSATSTCSVYGISITTGTTVNVHNNLIGDLRAPAASNTADAVRGISITSALASSSLNIYYNTIYLNATSTGTNFNTSGIFHTYSTTATTAALHMRNNIIVNTSTANGSGRTSAFRRSAATNLNNYGSTSNNNLLYAGTPGASNLIFYDGTNADQNLSDFQTRVGPTRDAASVSEMPTFLSTSGASANFLHLDPAVLSVAESGAADIATYTEDFDGDPRFNNGGYAGTGSASDIGADEYETQLSQYDAAVTAIVVPSPLCPGSQTVQAVIKNFGTATLTEVKVDWSVNGTPQTQVDVTGISVTTGNTTTVTLGSATFPSGSAANEVEAATSLPNNNTDGNAANDSYTDNDIYTGLSGNYNVGSGGDFTTLTAAVNAYNTSSLCGAVTFTLTNTTYTSGETFPITITANPDASAVNTLTIKPGSTASISSSNGTAILRLNGADYVTIDGSNNGTSSRDLTITNTNSSATTSVVFISSASASDGATNIVVKNCKVNGNTSTSTGYGITSGGATINSNALTNNTNITVENNEVTKLQIGISLRGATTLDAGYVVSNNVVGSTSVTADKLGLRGIVLFNAQNFEISNNTVRGVTSSISTSVVSGIVLGLSVSGGEIHNNVISDIKNSNTTGYGCNGLWLNASDGGNPVKIYNNMLWDIAAYGWTGGVDNNDNGYGIAVNGTAEYYLYYNSVQMTTNQVTGYSAAINIISTTTGALDLRNNIFANNQTSASVGKYAVLVNTTYSGISGAFVAINHNNYYSTEFYGFLNPNDLTSLSQIQTAYGSNTNSSVADPGFTSTTDLHMQGLSPLNGAGTPISGITTDFDGDTRDGSAPDVGADEFAGNTAPDCATYINPANGATNVVVNLTPTLLWQAALGATTYDVYFGTSSTPPFVANTSATSYDAGCLEGDQTYYWQIVPRNSFGTATGCAVQSFTTSSQIAIYIQNFDTWSEGMLSQITAQDGWLANNTADQSGFGDRNVWAIHDAAGLAVSGNSMGVSAYVINAPATGGELNYFSDLNTNRWIYRAIPTTNFKDITVSFNYRSVGEWSGTTGIDYGSVMYNPTGASPTNINNWLEDPSQGGNFDNNMFFNQDAVTAESILLPTDADNNGNFYLAFRWTSNANLVGDGPTFVVDDIVLSGCPGGGNITPLTSTFMGSGSATLTSNNVHSCASRQWQQAASASGPWTDIPGETGATYNTGTVTVTTYYRCEVSFGSCTPSYQTTPAVVTITSSCTAQTLTARANGTATSVAVCNGSPVTLTANPTGGSNCSGTFEYAWGDGTNYWNGTAFASATAVYSNAYTTLSATPSATTTYTAFVKCSNDAACVGNSSVTVTLLGTPATVSAAIGVPANGTAHHLNVTWSAVTGATGYDLEYSNNGTAWSTLASVGTVTTYDHNAGDNPNAPYYYRVRAKNGSLTCNWTEMATPRYTAADDPAVPVVSNTTPTTMDLTLAAETPVANPAITTYSIRDENTGLYVQANGSLGAVEVFQTKAAWATITVNGLSNSTQYCFYVTAKNNDGEISPINGGYLSEPFNSNVLVTNGNSSQWYIPPASGCSHQSTMPYYPRFIFSSTDGCAPGAITYQGDGNWGFEGCLTNAPVVNMNGVDAVEVEMDVTNTASGALNTLHFAVWVNGSYLSASEFTINGVAGVTDLTFAQARNCASVKVLIDLTSVPTNNRSDFTFQIASNCGYNDCSTYFVAIDNVVMRDPLETTCASTTACAGGTWTSNAGTTDWFTPGNWTCNTVPDATTDVVIPTNPAGGARFPVVNHATLSATTRNLTIETGASVTISYTVAGGIPDGDLEVSGVLTNNGSSNFGGGYLTMKGGSSLAGAVSVDYLKIDGNVALASGANVSVKKELTLKSGTLTTTNATLTLKSDVNNTAYVNDFTSGNNGSIAGNLTIERYIPTGLVNAFHYIGSASGGTAAMWNDNFTNIANAPNGTPVTPKANCDPLALAQGSAYGNLFSYDESLVTDCYQSGWRVSTTAQAASRGQGFAAVINAGTVINETGAYSKANTSATYGITSSNTVPTSKGYHLVANPFFAPIDWNAMAALAANNNMDATAYVYNPNSGVYGTYNLINAGTIATNMGFFVRHSPVFGGSSFNVTFDASTRIATNNSNFLRQGRPYEYALKIKATKGTFTDETLIAFDENFTDGYDNGYDANKLLNGYGRASVFTGTMTDRRAIQALGMNTAVKSVPLGLMVPGAAGNYSFTFEGVEDFPATMIIWLEDLSTGTIQYLRQNNMYSFTVNSGDDPGRFVIHFAPELLVSTVMADCSGGNGSISLEQRGGIEWTFRLKDAHHAVIASDLLNTTEQINQLAPGIYTLNLTHPVSGYATTMDIEVTGLQPVSAAINAPVTVAWENEPVSFTAQTAGAAGYTWVMGDGGLFFNETSVSYAFAKEGTYEVLLNAFNEGCSADARITVVVNRKQDPVDTTATGIGDVESGEIGIFENGDVLFISQTLERGAAEVRVTVYNSLGQVIVQERIGQLGYKLNYRMPVKAAAAGVYYVSVELKDGRNALKKVILGEEK